MAHLTVTDAGKISETALPKTKFVSQTEINREWHYRENFVENPEQVQDKNEYTRSGTDPGLVVIFNQVNFECSLESRTGSNRDVNELIVTLGRLGFNIDRRYICNDYTKEEIKTMLQEIADEDHTQRNCLIVIVLTHGDTNNLLYAKDTFLKTSDIWEPFSSKRCKTLKNKPKFFIFQACKGESYSKVDSNESEIISKEFFQCSLEPDFLVAFSAVEGNRSYRHIYNGTWFIQEMCRNFSTFGRRDDVVTLLLRTNKCVASNYYHISDKDDKALTKQMPLFLSTLAKRFYLSKSKDRNLTLAYLERQENIVKTLTDLTSKVNTLYEDYEGRKKPKRK